VICLYLLFPSGRTPLLRFRAEILIPDYFPFVAPDVLDETVGRLLPGAFSPQSASSLAEISLPPLHTYELDSPAGALLRICVYEEPSEASF